MSSFRISTDKAELDVPLIHRFLAGRSAWAKRIPLATIERAIKHSLCSVVSSALLRWHLLAWSPTIVDVFVLPEHRGRGYSKAIMQAVLSHSDFAASPSQRTMRMVCALSSDSAAAALAYGAVLSGHL